VKPQRKTVRANALVDALNLHDQTSAQRLQAVLEGYHARFVAPLEARLGYLETPVWKRVWHRVTGRWS
jgi:hypothetical protein